MLPLKLLERVAKVTRAARSTREQASTTSLQRGLASGTRGWRGSRVSGDKTHHVAAEDHAPLYGARFWQVLPFHAPGLAPAQLLDGRWVHIRPSGTPLAGHFLRTFGFYCERAAVTVCRQRGAQGWLLRSCN